MSKKKQATKPKESSVIPNLENMPDETKHKLEVLKVKLEKFKVKVLEKFDEYILGIALLPPSKDESEKEKINILLLIDDTDSTKMSKEELKDKLQTIISQEGEKIDKSLNPEVLLLTELWQNLYDAKYELLQVIANSAPIHDKGMLAAIKLTEIHKTMVLKKFEKYIVSYVFVGSLVQGKATAESDIDVFIVIDDTDVKKMTRVELKDKLRAIIIGMGIDAGKMTGVENKINIQVYILTDFWENIKEANPVIFTFLRDGIPLYDRGIFMPWKQLLQMGRVKPSPEAIDMFMHTGDQMLERVKMKIKEIGMEDFFWATLTPSQAALMLYGLPPPTPKETPAVLREIFVKKEKLLEDKYVKILEKVLITRKQMEHGTKKDMTGKELDELYDSSKDYLERMKKLFSDLENLREKNEMVNSFDRIITALRDVLIMEGVESVKDSELLGMYNSKLIETGKISAETLRNLKYVFNAKKNYDTGKITKAQTSKTIKQSKEIVKDVVEYIQRQRSKDLEKARIRVKYGDKYGEIIMLKEKVFIISDIDEPEKEIQTAKLSKEGNLKDIKISNIQELEAAIMNSETSNKKYLKTTFFGDLQSIFGKEVELLVNY